MYNSILINDHMEELELINDFLTYVLLGLSLTLPVGAVTIQMTKQGLRGGFWHGWSVGLGGMTVDLILIFFIYFGFSSVINQQEIQLFMWLIGFFFLLYLGIQSIRESSAELSVGASHEGKKSLLKSYFSGVMIAISPGYIVFWMGILGTVLASTITQKQSFNSFLFVASGIIVGILIHDVALSFIVHYSRQLLNQKAIKWVSIIAGILLIGFSFYFGYEFILELQSMH